MFYFIQPPGGTQETLTFPELFANIEESQTDDSLTAPVRISRPLKVTLAGTLGESSWTSSGMVMKPKLMRKETMLNMRSHLRNTK